MVGMVVGMRQEAPNGGKQDATIDLQSAGYMSTGAMAMRLGLGGALSAGFIVNELGIKPRMKGPTGTGYYWAPEQVRRALISRLLAQEFED